MSEGENRIKRPKPRFMYSTEASRASKVDKSTPSRQPPIATTHSVPVSKRQQFLQKATQRLTSLSASKIKPSRLPILSPQGRRHFRVSSLVLSSPVRRLSHLPEPVKKPLESPTDKPLPSLPVATFVPRSPVHRRSLIDATEKPLRRSLTPGNYEAWPALSPLKTPADEETSQQGHNMAQSSPPIKPSLGESVLEGMRNLHLSDTDQAQSRYASLESSKAYPTDYTPRPKALQVLGVEAYRHSDVYSPFLTPRPAPETPRESLESRTPSLSSLTRRISLQKLNISKVRRRSSCASTSAVTSIEPRNRPPSSYRGPGPETTVQYAPAVMLSVPQKSSSVHRSHRVSASGSPYATQKATSPKAVQLKRARGQIFDVLRQRNSRSASSPEASPATTLNWTVEQEPPVNTAIYQKHDGATTNAYKSLSLTPSDATVKHRYDRDGSGSVVRNKENLNPNFDEEEIQRTRNFRFPAEKASMIDDDAHSELIRVTSISSKAGTIYAQDEHGGYRLKPLSQADPKHGPRVRIEESADQLLLDEDQIALVEAKRNAYMRRYPSLERKAAHLDSNFAQEGLQSDTTHGLNSLRCISNETDATLKPLNHGQTLDRLERPGQPNTSAEIRKLAPAIPAKIPTGWPLIISKIAPFAETQAHANLENRRSASESDIRDMPGTPCRNESDDDCPGSAYTLRTALNNLPRSTSVRQSDSARPNLPVTNSATSTTKYGESYSNNQVKPTQRLSEKPKAKPRKSLPELVARPFFPPRNSSKVNTFPLNGLKKETETLLASYSNQRASLKDNISNTKSNGVLQEEEGHSHAHPAVTSTSIPSSPRYMQSYNTSLRHMDAHADVDSDLPSSPPVSTGTVQVSRPLKMKSKLSGIFHKPSKEGILRRSMSKITMKVSKEPFTPLGPPFQASPLVSSPMSRIDSRNSPPHVLRRADSIKKVTPPHGSLRKKSSVRRRDSKGRDSQSMPPPVLESLPAVLSEDVSLPHLMTSALEPIELRNATQLAFTLRDQARDGYEASAHGIQRHEYVELAKAIVNTVSVARDVEKAAEQAKQAAMKAEMEAVRTKKAVVEVCDCVEKMVHRARNLKRG